MLSNRFYLLLCLTIVLINNNNRINRSYWKSLVFILDQDWLGSSCDNQIVSRHLFLVGRARVGASVSMTVHGAVEPTERAAEHSIVFGTSRRRNSHAYAPPDIVRPVVCPIIIVTHRITRPYDTLLYVIKTVERGI